jgi:hypothetical protein
MVYMDDLGRQRQPQRKQQARYRCSFNEDSSHWIVARAPASEAASAAINRSVVWQRHSLERQVQ